MEIIDFSIHMKGSQPRAKVYGLGDLHLGAAACWERKLDETIAEIMADPNAYAIGLGDYADLILRQDMKRFTGTVIKSELLDMLDDMLNAQLGIVVKKLAPLAKAGKLIGLIRGNHERTAINHHSFDLTKAACDKLNVPYLKDQAFVCITLSMNKSNTKQMVTFFVRHGHSASRKPGAAINQQLDDISSYDFDVMMIGHGHHKYVYKTVRIGPSKWINGGRKIMQREIIVAQCGTYARTCTQGVECYSEQKGYKPTDIGSVAVELWISGEGQKLHMRGID
jgi:predicted phosphodiesterase